jgi:hypothetical protein
MCTGVSNHDAGKVLLKARKAKVIREINYS